MPLAAGAGLFGLALLLSLTVPASAGEVPGSALSQSLSLPPLLLDAPNLVFQFPQLAATRDSALLACGSVPQHSALFGSSTASGGYAAGAILRTDAVAGFGTAQGSYLADGGSAYDIGYNNHGSVLQAGLAGSWRNLRGGVAVRGARDRNERLEQQSYVDQSNTDVYQSTTNHLEGAFGVGASFRGATLDFVFEVYDQKYETGFLRLTSSDTIAAQANGNSHAYGGGALRLAVPVGDAVRVVAAGTYTHGELRWEGLSYSGLQREDLHLTQGTETWLAALGVLCRAPHVDVLALSASFARSYQPLVDASRSDGWVRGEPDHRGATCSLGCQRGLWRDLGMQGGLFMNWAKDNYDLYRTRLSYPGRTVDTKSRNETISHGFSMGLTYSWRGLGAAAAVRNNLPLGDLFATLDLRIDL